MNQAQCISAEASVRDTVYNIVRISHTFCGVIILIMLIRIIWSYKTKSFKLHTNLTILICNVLLLYTIFVLSLMSEAFVNFVS
uniref:G_PROTEIN_RECEP_F1_2 domain-containing protein n=1 Tax=Meloidogyne hapla TaxID=6305 RepID=A0A1I8BP94_MELHA